jgi:hypothetical protein
MADINNTFLTQVLSDPNFHIPIEANFAVGFTNLKGQDGSSNIISNLNNAYSTNAGETTDLGLDRIDVASRIQYWKSINKDDVFFVNSITLPGETVGADKMGGSIAASGKEAANTASNYGGFLGATILTGRTNVTNVEISFLETNQSFIDYVLRPWVIAASHYGLFARNPNTITAASQNFKTDIIVAFLDKRNPNGGTLPNRKTVTFKNAVPITVEGGTFAYGPAKSRNVKTTWTYTTYEIK